MRNHFYTFNFKINYLRNFILDILKFLGFVTISYIVLLVLFAEFLNPYLYFNLRYDRGVNDNVYIKIADIENGLADNVDILFLGSSHTNRSFDPRIFRKEGYGIFNLGSSAQSHKQTTLLLEDYLDEINPKLIVYDVYPAMFSNNGLESVVDFLTNEYPLESLWESIFELNHPKVYNTLLVRIYKKMLRQEYRTYSKVSKLDQYVEGGYWEHVNVNWDGFLPRDSIVRRIDDEQLNAFLYNLDFISKRGIPVRLVDVPIPSKYFDTHKNIDQIRDDISKFGDVKYFQNDVELVDTFHFYDHHHMNQKGVELFSPVFINWLKSENIKGIEMN